MPPLRVVFLGSDAIAQPLLDWSLGEGKSLLEVTAVFTQPDRPVGRGQKVTANEIKTWALGRALPVFQPEKLTEDVRLQLAALNADLALVMAYGHILRDDFIATPRLGTVNLHASILPHYRGASPIQTAIASGESETGVSFMRIVRRLDAGPVADIERVPIATRDTAAEIESKLARACIPLLSRMLGPLGSGSLFFSAQDDSAATFCRRLVKEDGVLDFSAPARVLAARINGLYPWPACVAEMGGLVVKLGLAEVSSAAAESGTEKTAEPGTILGADRDALLIATGEGVLRVLRLQRPGGRMLEAGEFTRGFSVGAGVRIPSRRMPVLVSAVPFKK